METVMPVYNILCPSCKLDKDIEVSYDEYCKHDSSHKAFTCPVCGKEHAHYSLTHLKENLTPTYIDILQFNEPAEAEKWMRGLQNLGFKH